MSKEKEGASRSDDPAEAKRSNSSTDQKELETLAVSRGQEDVDGIEDSTIVAAQKSAPASNVQKPKVDEPTPEKKRHAEKKLGLVLLEQGFINEKQLDIALKTQARLGGYLGQVLVERKFLTDKQLVEALQVQLNMMGGATVQKAHSSESNPTSPSGPEVSREAVLVVPDELAFKAKAMPLEYNAEKKFLKIGVLDTTNPTQLDEIRFKTGLRMQPVQVSREFIEYCWQIYYNWSGHYSGKGDDQVINTELMKLARSLTQDTVNSFITAILAEGVKLGASDIHIDPFEHEVMVRFRIDGTLYRIGSFKHDAFSAFLGRLKVLADIDVAEKRAYYDSRLDFKWTEGGAKHRQEFRVSILQAQFGEKVVLRVQRDSSDAPTLDTINMPKMYLEMVREKLVSPHGLMIVTGPTGSGKTTTLYAMLHELADFTKNIMTIEDPIEFTLQGTTQIAVDHSRGLGFNDVLRSALRQDPDVIMVGEVRDEETANLAVRASMTGHLVFSTMHTNDALSAVMRLQEMGVPSYAAGPALRLVIAQRLVRMLCNHCRIPTKHPESILFGLQFTPKELRDVTFYQAGGCSICSQTGYKGRIPVFEVLSINHELQDAIARGDSAEKLRFIARKHRYLPFRNLLKEYVKRGRTTLDEAMSYLIDSD